MAEVELPGGIKFKGGKIFVILTALTTAGGALWGGFEFYKDYLNMKEQIQEYVAPDLSGFDKRIDLTKQEMDSKTDLIQTEVNMIIQEMEMIMSEIRLVSDVANELKNDLRQDVRRVENAARMTAAGSYGGSRQAVLEGLFEEKLLDDISDAINTGNVEAYNQAIAQFNLEQDKKATAQDKQTQYGFDVIDKLADLGGVKRGIESEGIKADVAQFDEEMNFPYKQVQFMQSLLQNLPLETQQYTYASPSQLADVAGGAGGLLKLYELLFGGGGNTLLPGGLGKEA